MDASCGNPRMGKRQRRLLQEGQDALRMARPYYSPYTTQMIHHMPIISVYRPNFPLGDTREVGVNSSLKYGSNTILVTSLTNEL